MKKKNSLLDEYESEDESLVPKMTEETIEEVHSTIDWSEFGQDFEAAGIQDEVVEEEPVEEIVEEEKQEEDDFEIIRAEDKEENKEAESQESEEKAPAKKTTAKKNTAKKASGEKKTTAKKAAAKKTTGDKKTATKKSTTAKKSSPKKKAPLEEKNVEQVATPVEEIKEVETPVEEVVAPVNETPVEEVKETVVEEASPVQENVPSETQNENNLEEAPVQETPVETVEETKEAETPVEDEEKALEETPVVEEVHEDEVKEETPLEENHDEEVKTLEDTSEEVPLPETPVEETKEESTQEETKPLEEQEATSEEKALESEEKPAPQETVEEVTPVEAPVQETPVETVEETKEVETPVEAEEKAEETPAAEEVHEDEVKEETPLEEKAEETEEPTQEAPVEEVVEEKKKPSKSALKQNKLLGGNKPKVVMPTLPKNKLKKAVVSLEDAKEIENQVNIAKEKGFGYLYSPSFDIDNNIAFVQVIQTVEIDDERRMIDDDYHPVLEENGDIYEVNKYAILKALEDAKKRVDVKFVVKVSAKFLESDEKTNELKELLYRAPINIVLCFDARSLKDCKENEVARLYDLLNTTNLRMMLDNPEEERLSMLFEFPLYYLRIDGDYYQDKSVAQTSVLGLYASFARTAKIHLTAKNVNKEEQIKYLSKYGVKRFEGDAVIPSKLSLQDIYNALRKKIGA